jgi:hypothetical protein
MQGRRCHGQRQPLPGVVSARLLLPLFALTASAVLAQAPPKSSAALPAQVSDMPVRLNCAMDAMGGDPAYHTLVAYDPKTTRVYTSRGGQIASVTIADDKVTILHTVTPPDGEREVTTTVIDRHTGKIVISRDGGGVIETGTCKELAK